MSSRIHRFIIFPAVTAGLLALSACGDKPDALGMYGKQGIPELDALEINVGAARDKAASLLREGNHNQACELFQTSTLQALIVTQAVSRKESLPPDKKLIVANYAFDLIEESGWLCDQAGRFGIASATYEMVAGLLMSNKDTDRANHNLSRSMRSGSFASLASERQEKIAQFLRNLTEAAQRDDLPKLDELLLHAYTVEHDWQGLTDKDLEAALGSAIFALDVADVYRRQGNQSRAEQFKARADLVVKSLANRNFAASTVSDPESISIKSESALPSISSPRPTVSSDQTHQTQSETQGDPTKSALDQDGLMKAFLPKDMVETHQFSEANNQLLKQIEVAEASGKLQEARSLRLSRLDLCLDRWLNTKVEAARTSFQMLLIMAESSAEKSRDWAECADLFKRANSAFEAKFGPDDSETKYYRTKLREATAYNGFGKEEWERLDESDKPLNEWYRRHPGSNDATMAARFVSLGQRADGKEGLPAPDAAAQTMIEPLQRCADYRREHVGEGTPSHLAALSAVFESHYLAGNPDKAISIAGSILAMSRKNLGEQTIDTPLEAWRLGELLRQTGRLKEAEAMLEESVTTLKTVSNEYYPDFPGILRSLGLVYKSLGDTRATATLRASESMKARIASLHSKTAVGDGRNSAPEPEKDAKVPEIEDLGSKAFGALFNRVLQNVEGDSGWADIHGPNESERKEVAVLAAKILAMPELSQPQVAKAAGHLAFYLSACLLCDGSETTQRLWKISHDLCEKAWGEDDERTKRAAAEAAQHAPSVGFSADQMALMTSFRRTLWQMRNLPPVRWTDALLEDWQKELQNVRLLMGEESPAPVEASLIMAQANYSLRKWEAATALLEKYVPPVRRGGYATNELAKALLLSGKLSLRARRADEALQMVLEAQQLLRAAERMKKDASSEDSRTEVADELVEALRGQAEICLQLGDLPGAKKSVLEALEGARDQWKVRGLGIQNKLKAASGDVPFYDLLLSLTHRNGLSADDACRHWLQKQGQVFLEELRGSATERQLSRNRPELARKIAELRAATREMAESLALPIDAREQNKLIEKHKEQEARFAIYSTDVSTGIRASSIRLEDVIARVPEDAALVDYVNWMDMSTSGEPVPSMAAFVLRRGQPVRFVFMGGSAAVESAIAAWRSAMLESQSADGVERAGEELRALIWEPLWTSDPPPFHVIHVPDELTAYVPFGALPGKAHSSYLLDKHAFSLLPCPQMIESAFDPPPNTAKDATPFLAVGAIDYDKTNAQPPSTPPLHQFKFLAGAAEEMMPPLELVRFVSQKMPQMIRGANVSKDVFITAASNSRVTHLATHAYLGKSSSTPPEQVPWLRADYRLLKWQLESKWGASIQLPESMSSGLVLSGANLGRTSLGDGILTALELGQFDLSSNELFVLSACETALGQPRSGEGLVGLQRALQSAGVRTSIASLWKVDDAATQVLMTEFYQNLWQKKMSRLEALRQAQLSLLHGPDRSLAKGQPELAERGAKQRAVQFGRTSWTPPRFWAAWVLSGAPGALPE